jgi:hypothetical protein
VSFFEITGAQDAPKDSSKVIMDTASISKYFGDFSLLHIGYYGTAQNCIPYNIYAFKYKRKWFLYIVENKMVSLMLINPPIPDKKISYPSSYLAVGIAHCFPLNYTKFKKRKRSVVDINIYGFYKFNKYGKEVVRGLLLLDYPKIKKTFIVKKILQKSAKKKQEELQKKAGGIIEQVNKKPGEVEGSIDKATKTPEVKIPEVKLPKK